MTLPAPTADAIRAAVARYVADPRNALADRTLTFLFRTYPQNTDKTRVLLKVATLNALYSTQIYDVITVAKHIVASSIDTRLGSGDLGVVDLIARVTFRARIRTNYSFATKYCSWHRPDIFPICDDYVRKRLVAYKKAHRFARFSADALTDYPEFVKVLKAFQEAFKLQDIPLRDVDKFLWLEGKAASGA